MKLNEITQFSMFRFLSLDDGDRCVPTPGTGPRLTWRLLANNLDFPVVNGTSGISTSTIPSRSSTKSQVTKSSFSFMMFI